jgi:hypothetical protein
LKTRDEPKIPFFRYEISHISILEKTEIPEFEVTDTEQGPRKENEYTVQPHLDQASDSGTEPDARRPCTKDIQTFKSILKQQPEKDPLFYYTYAVSIGKHRKPWTPTFLVFLWCFIQLHLQSCSIGNRKHSENRPNYKGTISIGVRITVPGSSAPNFYYVLNVKSLKLTES